MPKVAQSRVISARLSKKGDGGDALSLFDKLKADGYSACSIITSALLAFGGRVPTDEDKTAQRIIDATTSNVQSMLDALKEEMLLAYGEQLIKELRNVSFVQSANNAPQRPHDAPVTDDEYDLMKRVAGTIMNRMKKAGG